MIKLQNTCKEIGLSTRKALLTNSHKAQSPSRHIVSAKQSLTSTNKKPAIKRAKAARLPSQRRMTQPEFTMKYDVSNKIIAQTSGLVDDAIESAHSREKAELQKALAARINEVENLAADVAYERVKNKTQAESIGQCLDEIDRLKRLVALRTQDLIIYQKELEAANNRADDAEYKAAEFERDLTVQRAWTWLFVLLAFVAATVGVVK
jgi:hypothetical protein